MMAPHATATDNLQDQDSAQQNSLKIYLTLFLVWNFPLAHPLSKHLQSIYYVSGTGITAEKKDKHPYLQKVEKTILSENSNNF